MEQIWFAPFSLAIKSSFLILLVALLIDDWLEMKSVSFPKTKKRGL